MSSILFRIEEGVAFITLHRPEKLNAFNREMALQLQAKLDESSSLHEVRCIYITGTGRAFSAGQDLGEVTDPHGPGMEGILEDHYNPIISRIRKVPKPVVAAINGVAAGAGANIGLAADIVVAAQSATFIQAFSKLGLIPDSGGTFTLPRLIGWQKASALMMTGDKVTASEAEKWGMLYKVFADEIFGEESKKIAFTLARMPTKALGYIKHLLNYSSTNNLEAQLLLEDEFQQKAAATEDFKEGIKSFLEKRPPMFHGH